MLRKNVFQSILFIIHSAQFFIFQNINKYNYLQIKYNYLQIALILQEIII